MSMLIYHRKSPEAAEIVADLMVRDYSRNGEKRKKGIQDNLDYVKKTVSFM